MELKLRVEQNKGENSTMSPVQVGRMQTGGFSVVLCDKRFQEKWGWSQVMCWDRLDGGSEQKRQESGEEGARPWKGEQGHWGKMSAVPEEALWRGPRGATPQNNEGEIGEEKGWGCSGFDAAPDEREAGQTGGGGPFVAARLSLKNPKILATWGTWVAQLLN